MTNPDLYTEFGVEPSLDEILAEPAVRTLMAFDGVDPEEVRSLMRAARLRLSSALAPGPELALAAAGD